MFAEGLGPLPYRSKLPYLEVLVTALRAYDGD